MRRYRIPAGINPLMAQQVAASRVNTASAASQAKREAALALLDPDIIRLGDGLDATEAVDGVVEITMTGAGGAGALDGGRPSRMLGGTAVVSGGSPGDR